MGSNSYRDLIVWRKSLEFSVKIYKVSEAFPKQEVYGLTSQLRRCSVSIPSNIAEGSKRGTIKDFINFLRILYGSTAELDTQLDIAEKIGLLTNIQILDLRKDLEEIQKMLNKLISKLSKN